LDVVLRSVRSGAATVDSSAGSGAQAEKKIVRSAIFLNDDHDVLKTCDLGVGDRPDPEETENLEPHTLINSVGIL
jgi:hypothetical protein